MNAEKKNETNHETENARNAGPRAGRENAPAANAPAAKKKPAKKKSAAKKPTARERILERYKWGDKYKVPYVMEVLDTFPELEDETRVDQIVQSMRSMEALEGDYSAEEAYERLLEEEERPPEDDADFPVGSGSVQNPEAAERAERVNAVLRSMEAELPCARCTRTCVPSRDHNAVHGKLTSTLGFLMFSSGGAKELLIEALTAADDVMLCNDVGKLSLVLGVSHLWQDWEFEPDFLFLRDLEEELL